MTRYDLAVWDFDGTLIPFDSEQVLLQRLPLSGLRALGARLFVYGDRRGWDPGALKRLYGWCLRGTSLLALEAVCAQIAASIAVPDRTAIGDLAAGGLRMALLSCGTADLSRGTLRAAGLDGAFRPIHANPLRTQEGRIAGIERRIVQPEIKVELVGAMGVPWERVIAVGDGLTDVPLLDRAGGAVLVAGPDKAARYAHRGYQIAPSLREAIRAVAWAAGIPLPSHGACGPCPPLS
jgi:phosphoserine phosphatase